MLHDRLPGMVGALVRHGVELGTLLSPETHSIFGTVLEREAVSRMIF